MCTLYSMFSFQPADLEKNNDYKRQLEKTMMMRDNGKQPWKAPPIIPIHASHPIRTDRITGVYMMPLGCILVYTGYTVYTGYISSQPQKRGIYQFSQSGHILHCIDQGGEVHLKTNVLETETDCFLFYCNCPVSVLSWDRLCCPLAPNECTFSDLSVLPWQLAAVQTPVADQPPKNLSLWGGSSKNACILCILAHITRQKIILCSKQDP